MVSQARANPERSPAARFSPFWFLLVFAAIWLVNHPGRVNADSLEQLVGAAYPEFRTDWHSPIVGWLWQIPAPLLGQPSAALLVQAVLVAFGAAVLPAGGKTDWRSLAALALDIGLKAALVALAGAISKDILLAALLLAATGAYRLSRGSARRGPWLGATAALLLFSALVRSPNILMFALAAALALPFFGSGRRQYFTRLGTICVALLAGAAIGGWLVGSVLRARPVHPEAQVVLFDIAGVSVQSGDNLFPRMPGWPGMALPRLETCYDPALWDNFAPWGRCRHYLLATRTAVERVGESRFAGWWLDELLAHPAAYARHRIAYMRITLGSGITGPPRLAVYGGPSALNGTGNEAALRYAAHGRIAASYFQTWDDRTMPLALAYAPLLMLWWPGLCAVALLACLLMLGAAFRWRRRGVAIDPLIPAAAALGIGNVVTMLVFGAASSPRYFTPLLLAAYLAGSALLRSRAPPAGPVAS